MSSKSLQQQLMNNNNNNNNNSGTLGHNKYSSTSNISPAAVAHHPLYPTAQLQQQQIRQTQSCCHITPTSVSSSTSTCTTSSLASSTSAASTCTLTTTSTSTITTARPILSPGDDEPLYDSVASEDDYSSVEQLQKLKMQQDILQQQKFQQMPEDDYHEVVSIYFLFRY